MRWSAFTSFKALILLFVATSSFAAADKVDWSHAMRSMDLNLFNRLMQTQSELKAAMRKNPDDTQRISNLYNAVANLEGQLLADLLNDLAIQRQLMLKVSLADATASEARMKLEAARQISNQLEWSRGKVNEFASKRFAQIRDIQRVEKRINREMQTAARLMESRKSYRSLGMFSLGMALTTNLAYMLQQGQSLLLASFATASTIVTVRAWREFRRLRKSAKASIAEALNWQKMLEGDTSAVELNAFWNGFQQKSGRVVPATTREREAFLNTLLAEAQGTSSDCADVLTEETLN